MLDLGASATWVDRGNKRTLLHSAANQGRADIARTLIDHGALLDAKDREGWTPLHLACFYGKTATATTLLLAGANPNSIDKMGQAPIHMAAMKGFDDIVSILVQSGADPSASDRSGWTARSLAEQYKHMAVLEALL